MPRLANYTVQCEGCSELVQPEESENRRRNGLIGLLLLGGFGVALGSLFGIATAGWGATAMLPLGVIGSYAGWKIGAGWARFRDGVTCPECEYVFGGYGEMSLPDGGELSLPSLRNDSDRSSSESEAGEPAFRIAFSCTNCGSGWVHGYDAGEEVVDAADIDRGEGVVVRDSADSKRLVCPTCESTRSVNVSERSPSREELDLQGETETERSLFIRLVDTVVYTGGSMLIAFAAAFAVTAGTDSTLGFVSFLVVLLIAAVIPFVYDVQIVG